MSDQLPNPSVVLFVVDVQGVARFYETVAAMKVMVAENDHVVLAVAGLELVVHRLRGEPDPRGSIDAGVAVREDAYLKLCLPVRSVAEARTMAAALGGSIKDTRHEWSARGFRACDGHDPEGNVIQVREPAG
ncbi:VOC family protein [Burkholderiaceae bacterium UC74_6]